MDISQLVNDEISMTGRKFKCPWPDCKKSFSRKPDLNRHYCIHTGERPFQCPFPSCDRSFIQRSALTIHIRTHTGERPHSCDLCNKSFADSSTLSRHRKIHLGVKPFACVVEGCGKRFLRRTALKIHMRTHNCVQNINEIQIEPTPDPNAPCQSSHHASRNRKSCQDHQNRYTRNSVCNRKKRNAKRRSSYFESDDDDETGSDDFGFELEDEEDEDDENEEAMEGEADRFLNGKDDTLCQFGFEDGDLDHIMTEEISESSAFDVSKQQRTITNKSRATKGVCDSRAISHKSPNDMSDSMTYYEDGNNMHGMADQDATSSNASTFPLSEDHAMVNDLIATRDPESGQFNGKSCNPNAISDLDDSWLTSILLSFQKNHPTNKDKLAAAQDCHVALPSIMAATVVVENCQQRPHNPCQENPMISSPTDYSNNDVKFLNHPSETVLSPSCSSSLLAHAMEFQGKNTLSNVSSLASSSATSLSASPIPHFTSSPTVLHGVSDCEHPIKLKECGPRMMGSSLHLQKLNDDNSNNHTSNSDRNRSGHVETAINYKNASGSFHKTESSSPHVDEENNDSSNSDGYYRQSIKFSSSSDSNMIYSTTFPHQYHINPDQRQYKVAAVYTGESPQMVGEPMIINDVTSKYNGGGVVGGANVGVGGSINKKSIVVPGVSKNSKTQNATIGNDDCGIGDGVSMTAAVSGNMMTTTCKPIKFIAMSGQSRSNRKSTISSNTSNVHRHPDLIVSAAQSRPSTVSNNHHHNRQCQDDRSSRPVPKSTLHKEPQSNYQHSVQSLQFHQYNPYELKPVVPKQYSGSSNGKISTDEKFHNDETPKPLFYYKI